MKKLITAFIAFFFPSFLAAFFLRLLGHKVQQGCKIGFSIIMVKRLSLSRGSRIGHFNIIKCESLDMAPRAYFGRFNVVSGAMDVAMKETAAIGNMNVITRAPLGVTYGVARLEMGILSKFTAMHKVDMTRSIFIGDYSTFAGQGSQVWTHGYYHHRSGPGRFRIDGEIHIGNNVYIGSACMVNAGLTIADGVTVGSNSTISKSLTEAGMYVSQPLRFIPSDPAEVEKRLKPVEVENLSEIVYEKLI